MDKINRLLACPICHKSLSVKEDAARCSVCGINYIKNGNVFSFICREMYPSDIAYTNAIKVIKFWGKGWEKRFTEPDHKFLFEFNHDSLISYVKTDVEAHRKSQSILAVELDLLRIEGKIALNIGCGAGTESLILSYFGAKTIAMDITLQAANAADYLIKQINKTGKGIQGDARFIPVENSSVDLVYSSGVLHHSPDIHRSIEEIHRVLKPGGHAYIMLYAKWSLMFMQQRIIGILKGNISKEKQDKYMAESGEGGWRTETQKNPHTDTFTRAACARLFMNYKNVRIRKGGFNLNQIAKIGKLISPGRLDYFSKKYLHFLEQFLGACIFIDAKK